MTAAKQLSTVAIAVLLVLSTVATPVLAGDDGGLTGDGSIVDDATQTVSETAEETTTDTKETVEETTTDTKETVEETTTDTKETVEETTDTVDDSASSGSDTDLGDTTDGIDTTSSSTTTSSTTSSETDSEALDSTASRHDWPTVGADPAHVGVNPDTTGPRVTLGEQWVAGPTNVSGSPVVANDTIYAVSENGTVVALSRDGAVRWSTNVSAGAISGTPTVEGAPSVDAGTVYVTGTGSDAGYVFALDAANGSNARSAQVGASSRASPVAVDGVVYVGSAPTGASGILTGQTGPLTAVYANGTQRWTATGLDAEIAAAPAVTDSFVYAATTAGTLYKVNRSDGSIVAQTSLTDAAVLAAPTVANGTVYVAATDSTVYAVSADDLSQVRSSAPFGGEMRGSPVVSDAGVYVATTTGTVARLDTSLATQATTTVDEGVTASLSMVDGTLYVPTESTVRTLDPDLTSVDDLSTPAAASESALTPSADVGYVGTDDGVFAVHELCDSSAIGADTVHVPSDCATIGSAVSAVASGGTVVVGAGTYDESVTLSKPVTLQGEGATLNSSYSESVALSIEADNVTVDGFAVEQYYTAVRVGAVDDVQVRNLTTSRNLDDVQVRAGGGKTSTLALVDSDLDALANPLVLNATTGGTITGVTVAHSTLRSDSSLPNVEAVAESGGRVTGVLVRDVTTRKGPGVVFEAGSGDSRIADIAIRDLSLGSPTRVADPGVRFAAAPTTGGATVENVSVADATLRGPYTTAVEMEAVTADGSGQAVVDGVTVRNATLAPSGDSTGLALHTRGDASTATPVVRNVAVANARINGTSTGIEVDTQGVGSVGPVSVTDSAVVDNDVGLRLAEGDASDVSITNSTVTGNADFGVANDGEGLLDATYNDWGDSSGPYDAATPDTDAADENPDGTGDAVTDNVTYRPWASPPEAVISTNATNGTANVSEVVAFESVSTDGADDIQSVEWAFGDGTTATGEAVTHAYESNGSYTVTLTVTDALGDSDTATRELEVVDSEGSGNETNTTNDTDATNETLDAVIETNATDGSANVSDPVGFDGGNSSGDVSSYEWTFDDGANATGETVSHTYESNGTYTVTLTVSDENGSTDTDSLELDVTSDESDADSGDNTTDSGSDNTTDTGSDSGTDDGTDSGSTGSGTDDSGSTDSGSTGDSSTSTGSTTSGTSGGISGGSTGGAAASTPTPTPTPTDTVLFTTGSVQSIVFDQPVSGDVSATALDELPAGMADQPGELLGATRIIVPAAAEDTAATIRFSVSVDQLADAGLAAEDVELARYNDGWEPLETTVVRRTDEFVYYEARTPGFSVFAAIGQPSASGSETPSPTPSATATASPTPTDRPTPTETVADSSTPTSTDPGKLGGDEDQQGGLGLPSMLGLVGLLAAIVLIGVVRLRRGDDDYEPSIRT